jgi:DNA polymerase elongation subunit (family B)
MSCSPPIYGLDIETDTRVDGLDPAVGRILVVAVATAEGPVVFADADEARLLDRLDWYLGSLEPGVIATWNGAKFDLPYLADRARLLGVRVDLRLSLDPTIELEHPPLPGHGGAYRAAWGSHAHLDAYRLYRADVVPALHISGSLKSVARACGLRPIATDAARVHELDRDQLEAYVVSDATCTRELARRRWPGALPMVDRLPVGLPGQLRGAVSAALLRARATRASRRGRRRTLAVDSGPVAVETLR